MPLSVKQLACQRGQHRLFDALSFDLTPGACLHITGANGSGKSSLLRILCGLLPACSGTVNWLNNSHFTAPFAYLGHSNGLKGEFSAAENLHFYQLAHAGADEFAIDQALEQVALLECAERVTAHLSFGQQRKLAFARILLAGAQVWLLDEPFTGIDENGRQLIENLCLQHLQKNGSIILTHHHSMQGSALTTTELSI